MDAVQNSVEQQREQLVEDIKTLPADVLQEVANLVDHLQKREETEAEKSSEQPSQSPYDALKEAGLVGFIKDGPSDLSTNYKQYIIEYLEEKHGYR